VLLHQQIQREDPQEKLGVRSVNGEQDSLSTATRTLH